MLGILALLGVAAATIMITDADHGTTDDDTIEEQSDTLSVSADGGNDDESVSLLDDLLPLDSNVATGETLTGTANADILRAGDTDDVLDGREGEDLLYGSNGDDTLYGGQAMDSLFGGNGDDFLDGGDHEDDLIGGDGDDLLFGGDGEDSLLGSFGADTLSGGEGRDLLNGGAGNDVVRGNDDADADYLNGGRGDDRLEAGAEDTLHGGSGQDTFALDVDANGGAYIADYDPEEDVIEVVYDAETPEPILSTQETNDGIALFADEDFVAGFANVSSLDLSRITLVAA